MRRDRRVTDLFGIELPILLAPMAGAGGPELAIAVAEAGGLGAIPSAMLSPADLRNHIAIVRQRTPRPINVNFFCHVPPPPEPDRERAWLDRLRPYYAELGIPEPQGPGATRNPFDDAMAAVIAETRPEVVSFHFGLPEKRLRDVVRQAGAKIIASATTAAEARWLEAEGCDAIIAQGAEAGGHRGIFLSDGIASQPGLFALLPQVVDAVKVPVIAAGGIADPRGVAAAFVLGASAVQVGTAYLRSPESIITALHRAALATAADDATALTNVFTGRPARGIVNRAVRDLGPIADDAPSFPLAARSMAPLRTAAEAKGSSDFTPLWSGQAARLARALPAAELTRWLAAGADAILGIS